MKRSRLVSTTHAIQVASTVSAAALMLGVSHAATIGFNFQVDWTEDGTPSYTGRTVSATAFGIATNGWESLDPVPTGYSSAHPGPFTTNEVIDATTSTGGLNPLPPGASIQVTWSCTAANSSGFAGYGIPYSGTSTHPGEEEVYYGFLRDEANIYTSPVGGPIPYAVTVTGLRSVWTNTPYAVELIASTDTGNYITNAYIGSLVSTQQVSYDVYRPSFGIIGGLSTSSGPWTNDSISIWGAPAVSHTNGYAAASTICGFIITDVPVISMQPQPVPVLPGDTVTWSGYAVGVPPLAYQWRKDGVPISGATNSSFTLTATQPSAAATYDLVVTNAYGSAVSSNVVVDQVFLQSVTNLVVDSNPAGPERDGLDFGATWLASSGGRTNVMSFNGTNSNQITVPPWTNFNSAAGAITFWMQSTGPINTTGNDAMIFDHHSTAGSGAGLVIAQAAQANVGALHVQTTPNSADDFYTGTSLNDGNWHFIAVVFQTAALQTISVYIDSAGGPAAMQNLNGADWSWPVGQELELGLSHDASLWQPYNGGLADVRVYNRVLTDAEVGQVMSGSVVDNQALILRLNFGTAPVPGLLLDWQLPGAGIQSSSSVTGPYQTIPGAMSPYATRTTAAQQYYRYDGAHSATNLVTNPVLM